MTLGWNEVSVAGRGGDQQMMGNYLDETSMKKITASTRIRRGKWANTFEECWTLFSTDVL